MNPDPPYTEKFYRLDGASRVPGGKYATVYIPIDEGPISLDFQARTIKDTGIPDDEWDSGLDKIGDYFARHEGEPITAEDIELVAELKPRMTRPTEPGAAAGRRLRHFAPRDQTRGTHRAWP